MRSYKLTFQKALATLLLYRPVASPNRGFIAQLQIYEKDLRDFYGGLDESDDPVVRYFLENFGFYEKHC